MQIGCDQVQGYSIAFPMPDRQARDWLKQRTARKPRLAVVSN
jgi:EAL domain-containing protein (putative c-di-GMP-specific phosphodiesterase class I)